MKSTRKVTYRTCQICGRALRIRADGKFPVHRTPRELKRNGKLPTCMGSQVYP